MLPYVLFNSRRFITQEKGASTMASLFIFTLSTLNQADMFLSKADGKFDINKFRTLLESRAYLIDKGRVKGEGFSNIEIKKFNDFSFLKAISSAQSSLGYYYEARVDNGVVSSERVHHEYYTKSNIIVTENSQLIIKFDWTAEEISRTRVKTLLESLGLKLNPLRINDQLLRSLKNMYPWTAAKIDKIDKDGDSTKKVSYEIDPSNDQNTSVVDEQYSDHGKMSHLTFELPFKEKKHVSTPSHITVKLYSEGGHRIILNEDDFGHVDDFENFLIYLIEALFGTVNNEE